MTEAQLLKSLQPCNHHQRVQRMISLGQKARGDPTLQQTIARLEKGGGFERRLALASCQGSRDGAHVLRSICDPYRAVRGLAMRLVPLLCDDRQAQTALGRIRGKTRRALLRRLRRYKRYAAIDAFIAQLVQDQDHDLPDLLAYASEALVRKHLDLSLSLGTRSLWARLGRIHPTFAEELLIRRMAEGLAQHPRLKTELEQALPGMARCAPLIALDLMRHALEYGVALPDLPIRRLLRWAPNGLVQLKLDYPDGFRAPFQEVAHRIETMRLRRLISEVPTGWSVQSLALDKLSPNLRGALFTEYPTRWQDDEGIIPSRWVKVLPRVQRVAEARRHWALPTLATRDEERLAYAAYLPWEEMRCAVDPFLSDPEAELRQAALEALIGATRYDAAQLGAMLQIVTARKNEQDPVRLVLLRALSELPPSRFGDQHVEQLGQVLRDALDAPDLSHATASFAQLLVIRLLPFKPAWAATWIATLVKERGQLQIHELEQRLSDREVQELEPHLAPVIKSWEARERQQHLVAMTHAFGRRLRVFDSLAKTLQQIALNSNQQYVVREGLAALAKYRRLQFDALVPRLLKEDASRIMIQPVHQHLHRWHQEMLDPYLGQTRFKGRFSSGRNHWILPLADGFFRWLPAQQEVFGTTLTRVIRETSRDTPTQLACLYRLAALPDLSPKTMISRARSSTPVIRDTALRLLAQVDGEGGLEELLAAVQDKRARVAIYALRSALLELAPERALSLLKQCPMTQVTVAKEVLRLMGELPLTEALDELIALDKDPDLHRDVRVALLRALWGHLHHKEAWAPLERASQDPDPAVAVSLIAIPTGGLNPAGFLRLSELLTSLLSHPAQRVRQTLLARLRWHPVADPQGLLLPKLAQLISSEFDDERAAAAGAFLACAQPGDLARIAATFSGLLPNRRALHAALGALQNRLCSDRRSTSHYIAAVLEALAQDPLTASAQTDLALSGLPWDQAFDWLEKMAQQGQLHADALAAADLALTDPQRPDLHQLADLQPKLAQHSDPRLRRLALSALMASASVRGWDDEHCARLATLQADKDPLVAGAAQFTFTPERQTPAENMAPVTLSRSLQSSTPPDDM